MDSVISEPAASAATAPRAVIFNADDLGLTPGVTAGVIEAHRHGLVCSASLMVTALDFAGAVAAASEQPALDLGIHLALTDVSPVLPPRDISTLVAPSGRFPSLGAWLQRMARRSLRPHEVERELRAQVERALATGLPFSHIDSHHHVHLFGPVARVVAGLAREHDIPYVRRIVNQPRTLTRPAAGLKRLLLGAADARSGPAFDGLRRADAFRGVPFPANLDSWETMARTLPTGVTEFMCHPGRVDALAVQFDPLGRQRELELDWLCDARVAGILERAGVAAASFSELRAARVGAGGRQRDDG